MKVVTLCLQLFSACSYLIFHACAFIPQAPLLRQRTTLSISQERSFCTRHGQALSRRCFALQATTTPNEEESTTDYYTYQSFTLSKPMGLILEEIDPETTSCCGVQVANMGGAVAKRSRDGTADIAIGDELVSIQGQQCISWTFEQVMDRLGSLDSPIDLTFRRKEGWISVLWAPSGVAVACPPGTRMKDVARILEAPIKYSCSAGDCTTCQQTMICPGKEPRYVRPCVARVPKGQTSVALRPE